MAIVHHAAVCPHLRSDYRSGDVQQLRDLLGRSGTLDFAALPTGLFPAAHPAPPASGYDNAWVRDNVFVALAHEEAGLHAPATAAAQAMATFLGTQRHRLEAVIEGLVDARAPASRPHVRFDGTLLSEVPTRWPHAQNDALGYFLWLYSRLALRGRLAPDRDLLALLASYLERIRYWEDEDSGHWEETRKVSASSIGCVVAGLRALRALREADWTAWSQRGREVAGDRLDDLIGRGEGALASILPAECVQREPGKARRHDAALLFLVYPLEVVDEAMGERIAREVVDALEGPCGVRRYLGDSYWTADYKEKVPEALRTADFSEGLAERDALSRPGEEAQWCLFDPILSVIAGRQYLRTGAVEAWERQVRHVHRTLGQLTGPECPAGGLRCPEAYYLHQGRWVPNDHVPLYWAQANLWLALLALESSATRRHSC